MQCAYGNAKDVWKSFVRFVLESIIARALKSAFVTNAILQISKSYEGKNNILINSMATTACTNKNADEISNLSSPARGKYLLQLGVRACPLMS